MVAKEKTRKFRQVNVEVIEGETGQGKTRHAYGDEAKDIYKIEGDSMQWWDGYEGEKTIVIDEYSNQLPITKLLNILDGYQLRLPIKGGHTYANWTKVYITTNNPWEEWHEHAKPMHRDALKRRITKWTTLNNNSALLGGDHRPEAALSGGKPPGIANDIAEEGPQGNTSLGALLEFWNFDDQ